MILRLEVDVFQVFFHLVVQVIDYLLVVDETTLVVVEVVLKSCRRSKGQTGWK